MNQWTIEVGETDFEKEVLERSRRVPVMVDFWAPWCGPCRILGPVLERLAEEQKGAFILAKVNVDENSAKAAEFGVRALPTLILFRDGKPVQSILGVQPKSALKATIDSHLA